MLLDGYARRLKNGKLDPEEVWPKPEELPKGIISLKQYKKGLIDKVLPLCLQSNVSNARKTACQYVAFCTRSKPVSLFFPSWFQVHLLLYHILKKNAKQVEEYNKKKKGKPVTYMKGPGSLCQLEGIDDEDCIDILRTVRSWFFLHGFYFSFSILMRTQNYNG